jgi:hemoglobin
LSEDEAMTPFDELGGEFVLRGIVRDFVERMADDPMIGSFFRKVDKANLAEMEYQFTAKFLGAPIDYAGRTIRDAHAAHPIMGGHFDRRRKILADVLQHYDVPIQVQRVWLAHVDALRAQVTRQAQGECE